MKLTILVRHMACMAAGAFFLSGTLGAWVRQASVGVAVAGAGSAAYYTNEWWQAKKELKALETAEKLHGQRGPKGRALRTLIAARKKSAISSFVALLAALAAYKSRVGQPKKEDASTPLDSAASGSIIKPHEARVVVETEAEETSPNPRGLGGRGEGGRTRLMRAAHDSDVDEIQALIDADVAKNATSKKELEVIEAPEFPKAKPIDVTLVEAKPEEALPAPRDLEERDKDGFTRLMRAALDGDVGEMLALIDAGADVNAKDSDGRNALCCAVVSGRAEAIEALIAAGADVNARDSYDGTALMFLHETGYTEAIEALIAAGADVNAKDSDGRNALWCAADKCHTEAIEALIAAGADVNAKDSKGRTALWFANYWCSSGDTEEIELLKAAGAR